MFTYRSFYLITMLVALMVTACSPQIVSTPISSTATLAPTLEASSTLKPTMTLEASTPLIPTATEFEGRLLFARFTESTHTFNGTYIARTDGSAEIEVPMPWTEGGGIWSKSGKEIAVATLLADGRVGTAIIEADGTLLRELSIPDATLNLPCVFWSPDDTRLACEGWDEADSSRNGIYTVNASDGTDVQRLTTPPAGKHDCPGHFSPDGRFVFKRAASYEDPGQLMIVDGNGGEPRLLYDGPINDCGDFSPDGRLVLTSANGSLLVIDLDGKVVHRISFDDYVAFIPIWSPDGTRIAFSMTRPGVYSADIYTSLPDGTDLQQMTNTPANEFVMDWRAGD